MTARIGARRSLPVQRARDSRAVGKRCSQCQRARARRGFRRPAHEHLRRLLPIELRRLRFPQSRPPFALAFIDAGKHYTAVPKVFDIYRRNAGFKAEYPPGVVLLTLCSTYTCSPFKSVSKNQSMPSPTEVGVQLKYNDGQSPTFYVCWIPARPRRRSYDNSRVRRFPYGELARGRRKERIKSCAFPPPLAGEVSPKATEGVQLLNARFQIPPSAASRPLPP